MKTIKYSRQREAIKGYLAHSRQHPTADMVYAAIREVYPNVSLGTVYRNLTFLVDQGDLIRIKCGNGVDRFDGRTDRHYHFVCQKCGSVTDLDLPSLELITALAQSGFCGKILGHETHFYGICENCLNKGKDSP